MPGVITAEQNKIELRVNKKFEDNDLEELVAKLSVKVEGTTFSGFKAVRSDSQFLKKFIRIKDGNIDGALKAMKKYYACIKRNLNIINGAKANDIRDALNCGVIQVLESCFDGVAVAWVRIWRWEPKKIDLSDMELTVLYLMEAYGQDLDIQENGIAIIVDLTDLRFEHVWNATPKELFRIFNMLLDGLPVRVNGVHLVNPPTIFWPVYKIIMRILKEKLRKRLIMHSNNESLHEYFDKEKLPLSLSGTLEEDDAVERHVINELIEKNIEFEENWNPGWSTQKRL